MCIDDSIRIDLFFAHAPGAQRRLPLFICDMTRQYMRAMTYSYVCCLLTDSGVFSGASATHCTTLHHAATHCNTLQHTAT